MKLKAFLPRLLLCLWFAMVCFHGQAQVSYGNIQNNESIRKRYPNNIKSSSTPTNKINEKKTNYNHPLPSNKQDSRKTPQTTNYKHPLPDNKQDSRKTPQITNLNATAQQEQEPQKSIRKKYKVYAPPVQSLRIFIRKTARKKHEVYVANADMSIGASFVGTANDDSRLYRDIVRKNSWYVGVGEPISRETALHLPFYYKLSLKNEKGHWQHVAAMRGDTLTSGHDKSPYVVNKRYDTGENNEEWRERVQTVAHWYLISGLDADELIEERAYTAGGDMVYSFIPVKNADGTVVGSYNDAWGLPIDMNEDSTGVYGSVVRITYDACGRDSVVAFVDGQGYPKPNPYGADQQHYVYDAQDRVILSTSHNVVGDYALDNWGNCGNRYTYNEDTDGYSVVRVDNRLNPMRMPELRADATQTFVRCDVVLDNWGRVKERIMRNADGSPDETSAGIHKILYTYGEKNGRLESISVSYVDREGNAVEPEDIYQ